MINHIPNCRCADNYQGNAFDYCYPVSSKIRIFCINLIKCISYKNTVLEIEKQRNVCIPSPCGPNSQCRDYNQQPVCSCIEGYLGSPPYCRPECINNSDCPLSEACLNNKCTDPCPGVCGLNALCHVNNHSPYCQCQPSYTGNPFLTCKPIVDAITPIQKSSCHPSPCGPYAECHENGGTPSCVCLPNYLGSPPNCHPECLTSSECLPRKACIKQKCIDPCPGLCGSQAECRVKSHIPSCFCPTDYEGDPFVACTPKQISATNIINPCNPNPCGTNAQCQQQNGAGSCQCLPEYFGNPYEGCRPECILNSDCPNNLQCINNKCRDPCPGTCGQNAMCYVQNHVPTCSCNSKYTGDPYTICHVIKFRKCILEKYIRYSNTYFK